MATVPVVTSVDHSYLIDTNGEYVVADTTTPNGPLVTDKPSLTSNARHVITRSGSTVVAASSGRDIYTRGGIGSLVTDRPSLIVQPFPTTGSIAKTYGLALYGTATYAAVANSYDIARYGTATYSIVLAYGTATYA